MLSHFTSRPTLAFALVSVAGLAVGIVSQRAGTGDSVADTANAVPPTAFEALTADVTTIVPDSTGSQGLVEEKSAQAASASVIGRRMNGERVAHNGYTRVVTRHAGRVAGVGMDLRGALQSSGIVVVGRVEASALVLHDEEDGLPVSFHTDFTIEVEEWIVGNTATSSRVIHVTQRGGIRDGVLYRSEGDEPMRVGERLLLFLDSADGGTHYVGFPFLRFPIGADGRLRSPDVIWKSQPTSVELSGLTESQAVAKLRSEASFAQ